MSKSRITKRAIICSVVVAGVIIIPLLYSILYLGAFWDPYSKLEKLPVAVVNEDTGAVINGESKNIGKELCSELKEDGSLKFVFTDENNAKKGTEGSDYYAYILIPKSFSSDIASASTKNKRIAEITYSANEKRNYLASQILSKAVLNIESKLRGKVDSELVSQLAAKLKEVPQSLTDLSNGLNKMQDGSGQLKDGSSTLVNGTSTLKSGAAALNEKMGDLSKGINSASSGSASLANGISALQSGIIKLNQGASQLDSGTADIDSIRTGAAELATGTSDLNNGIIAYTAGVDQLITQVQQTGTFLQSYVTAHPTLMADPTFAQFMASLGSTENTQKITLLQQSSAQLKSGSATLAAGAKKLSDGTSSIPTLKQGITDLKNGLAQVSAATAQISSGAGNLKSGLSALSDGASKLKDGAADLSSGAAAVNNGAVQIKTGITALSDGILSAASGVTSSVNNANEQIAALDGLDTFAEEPVKTNIAAIEPVPNYGTAFSPYFMSLSLWVGAIIIFFGIYFDPDGKFKLLSRNSDKKILRSFAYLLIGLVQAVLLATLIRFGLGLTVIHPFLYYIACCLVSMVCIAIVQFCIVILKDMGKFITIALLILQLTSCGGTFPMETVPSFFNVLYPFMPMTYFVGLFKEVISGDSLVHTPVYIALLTALLLVFITLNAILSVVKSKNENKVA